MEVSLVVNARSGSAGASPDDLVQALSACGAQVTTFDVGEHEEALARQPERLVVAGGDGSLGPAAAAAAAAGVPLAVIPTGTANDFARVAEIPMDVREACELAVRGTVVHERDLGACAGRPFVNVAGVGLSVRASTNADDMKGALGATAYAVGAARAAMSAKPVACDVSVDGRTVHAGHSWQVIVACSGAFGGGSRVEADPSDGMLDVLVIPAGPRAALVLRAAGLALGRVGVQKGVVHERGRVVVAHAPRALTWNVDGELVTCDSPATVEVLPKPLRLVVG